MMFLSSNLKCIKCNIFYKRNDFFKEDIFTMKYNGKLLFCKKCTVEKILSVNEL